MSGRRKTTRGVWEVAEDELDDGWASRLESVDGLARASRA